MEREAARAASQHASSLPACPAPALPHATGQLFRSGLRTGPAYRQTAAAIGGDSTKPRDRSCSPPASRRMLTGGRSCSSARTVSGASPARFVLPEHLTAEFQLPSARKNHKKGSVRLAAGGGSSLLGPAGRAQAPALRLGKRLLCSHTQPFGSVLPKRKLQFHQTLKTSPTPRRLCRLSSANNGEVPP